MKERMEYNNYKSLAQKLADLLAENNLLCSISTYDPFTVTVKPNCSPTAQMSMIEDAENGIFGREAKIVFVFEDGEMSVRTVGKAVLPEKTLDKIKGLVKKVHYAYLQWFFLDTMEQTETAFKLAEAELQKRLVHIYDVSCGAICLLTLEKGETS